MEARLQRWAQTVTVGDGSGYPVMNVLHHEWQPPSPGITPTMKTAAASDARETHQALRQLSQRLQNTVAVHYCMKLPLAQQAERLGCAVDTVHGRIEAAHKALAAALQRDEEGASCYARISMPEDASRSVAGSPLDRPVGPLAGA